ncbi:MAG: leucine-rich repeat protein [Clostridiales bacterium]|nr:leucine-rich repeat protein [Clostridiales bacterium]
MRHVAKKAGIVLLVAIVATLFISLIACNPTPNSQNKFTVIFDANGGSFVGGSKYTQEVDGGSKLTAPASPTRTNYTFSGWAKNKIGSDMWKFDEDTVTSDTTLYAQWTQQKAAILSVDGASIDGSDIFILVSSDTNSVSLSSKVVCSDGATWKLYYDVMGQMEIPTKVAAGLAGSLTNGNNVFYVVVTSDDGTQTNTYTLMVHRSYEVSVSYYNDTELLKYVSVYTGENFTADYAINIVGYTFNGWRDSSGKAFTTDTIWSSLSLYADKTANQYNITLNVNGGDDLEQTIKVATYDEMYTLPVPTRRGYLFTGWYVGNTQITDSDGSSLAKWQYESSTDATAHWQPNKYVLTVSANNSNAGTVSGGGTYNYDSNVTVTAQGNLGYAWDGWYDGDNKLSNELSYTFAMTDKNVTYVAKWDIATEMSNLKFTSTTTICEVTGVYDSTVTKLIVPEYVTAIERGAFSNCTNLQSITIPFVGTSQEEGGNDGYFCRIFGGYDNSGSKYVPKTLKEVIITRGIKLCQFAFSDCSNIERISIPDTLQLVNNSPFIRCSSLRYNEYDNALYLGNENNPYVLLVSAKDKAITSCVINENTKLISSYAFSGCSNLASITIPKNVVSLEDTAFGNCTGLTTVTFEIGSKLTTLRARAFLGCSSLSSITIPSSVTSIDNAVFGDCSSLTSVTFENPDGWWYSSSYDAASGTKISELNNASMAARYLTDLYRQYYWRRNA